ncbi:hypothetical protein LshimejAT787_0804690 [Lyophyllum shimeji]|uniref:Uncharacterized protein n=1 Tax=Lyophyllum shimeji TaxID=47721 RepID=A0A9P3UPF0_LYOSH|nr:hypothetical protein LshimejAT787_0804690 [Lyophyllum shimeji]
MMAVRFGIDNVNGRYKVSDVWLADPSSAARGMADGARGRAPGGDSIGNLHPAAQSVRSWTVYRLLNP